MTKRITIILDDDLDKKTQIITSKNHCIKKDFI